MKRRLDAVFDESLRVSSTYRGEFRRRRSAQAWKKFQILVYEYRRECKALIIQCAWRCYLARCRRGVLLEQKRRSDAATMIQCRERQEAGEGRGREGKARARAGEGVATHPARCAGKTRS